MDGMDGAGFEFDRATTSDAGPCEIDIRGGSRARRAANEALGDRIAEQAFHLDAALHRLLADLRTFDASNHWADAGARSCASWLSWRVGWDPGTARERLRVARALGELPRIDAALREGRLSYSKVRAITRVAAPATEAALLDDALCTTAAQLEIICRGLRSVQRQGALSTDDVRARRTSENGRGSGFTFTPTLNVDIMNRSTAIGSLRRTPSAGAWYSSASAGSSCIPRLDVSRTPPRRAAAHRRAS